MIHRLDIVWLPSLIWSCISNTQRRQYVKGRRNVTVILAQMSRMLEHVIIQFYFNSCSPYVRVLIVYICFQDNTSALLLWNWCFHCRSYHSFTEPTATLQKEHQICFRAHERCKNIDISSVNMRNICSDFILKAGAEGVELKIICIQYKFFYMFSAQITFEIKTICTVSRIFL